MLCWKMFADPCKHYVFMIVGTGHEGDPSVIESTIRLPRSVHSNTANNLRKFRNTGQASGTQRSHPFQHSINGIVSTTSLGEF
jgi:hypothetical protein